MLHKSCEPLTIYSIFILCRHEKFKIYLSIQYNIRMCMIKSHSKTLFFFLYIFVELNAFLSSLRFFHLFTHTFLLVLLFLIFLLLIFRIRSLVLRIQNLCNRFFFIHLIFALLPFHTHVCTCIFPFIYTSISIRYVVAWRTKIHEINERRSHISKMDNKIFTQFSTNLFYENSYNKKKK